MTTSRTVTLTQARLKQVLHYDPETGIFTRCVSCGGIAAGQRAGTLDKSTGYRQISIDNVRYYEHRLAWFYVYGVWPEYRIDHRHGIKDLNKLTELRCATPSENGMNSVVPINNTSGYKGVTWDKQKSKWRAQIKINKKTKCLGLYIEIQDAVQARREAELKLFGEFRRAG